MKRHYAILILIGSLVIFLSSCLDPHFLVVESCRTLNGIATGGYAVEIQGISDIGKLDINRTVRSFSRSVKKPRVYDWKLSSSDHISNYNYVIIFHDPDTSIWFSAARYVAPNAPPSALLQTRGSSDTRVRRLQLKPSQKSLRFWVSSLEETCASPSEESIPNFKKRISFLSFRLYYNDRIYDAEPLLRYEKETMFIDKNKVKRVQPTTETKDNFYPPFFMKKPGYILSTGLHEVQFSDLRLVPPGEVVKK